MINKKIVLALGIAVLAIFGVVSSSEDVSLGSLSNGQTYSYKSVSSADASSTAAVVVRKGTGELGSITVASTSGSQIRIYDGSSSTSTATLIGTIKASVAEQTFVYDVAVKSGLILDVPAAHNGVFTVTYR